MAIITRAHMLIMMAQDKLFEETVEFYKKMGINPKFHLKDRWAEFELENIIFGLCPIEEELPDRRVGIVFQVADLNKIYEEEKDTITFLDKPTEAVHGIMASIKDPAGNVFDLYQPTPEKVIDLAKRIKDAEDAGHCCASDCSDCHECSECDACDDCDDEDCCKK